MTVEEKQLYLLDQMETIPFDSTAVLGVLTKLGDINQPFKTRDGFETTFLQIAQENNNYDAVKLLLENGANPNEIIGEGSLAYSPLWDLQYPPDDPKDTHTRLEIAKLFFEHGADPSLKIDGERLYDYVMFKVFNEMGDSDWEYTLSFYKLLVAYDAEGDIYGKPSFSEPIDKRRIDEYDIKFYRCEDGYHIEAYLENPNGEEIGRL